MAASYTVTKQGIVGDLKYQIVQVTLASVTTGAVVTGMSNVIFATPNNPTSEDGKLKINRDAADSATEYGTVLLTSFTSNDVVDVFILGI